MTQWDVYVSLTMISFAWKPTKLHLGIRTTGYVLPDRQQANSKKQQHGSCKRVTALDALSYFNAGKRGKSERRTRQTEPRALRIQLVFLQDRWKT